MEWKIPLFTINFDQNEYQAVQQVLESNWLTMGEQTNKFETEFAEYMNVKHAIAVSSCTAALHLAHLALGIVDDKDEVILPSLTFVAGAHSIVNAGARPVFAEIKGTQDFNISSESIKEKITPYTKAIQIVHFPAY